MAEVLLFHHVQGLTAGVERLADRLRQEGHGVHVPDLFDGQVFSTLDEGVAHARSLGFDSIIERGKAAAEGLPDGLVYAGISMGVMPAQALAQTRLGARGALLLEACVPPSEFGGPWPDGVPVEVHGMDADPSFAGEGDIDAARELVASVSQATLASISQATLASTPQAALHLYPGDRHLFCDSSLPSYDEQATDLLVERVLAFLARQTPAS